MRFSLSQLFYWTTNAAFAAFATRELVDIIGWPYTLVAWSYVYGVGVMIWVERDRRNQRLKFSWTPEQVD